VRVVNQLLRTVRSAGLFNPEVHVAPACILWPDQDRQWEAIIPRLQKDLPELFVFGNYSPENRTGPGIWLRCVIAGKVEAYKELLDAKGNNLPVIIYLPGISRQDLRAVESCPDHLKPLAELQYRGVIWSQINAKDWTILAYLKSDQGGLGLDVAQDNDTKNAMKLALYLLLDEDLELLRDKRLDKDYFNTLLTGGDPVRDLLQWLDQGEAFQIGRDDNEWKAFVAICKSQLAFNPQKEGLLAGASKLAIHKGPWQAVWDRYCEAPKRYPNIPDLIRKCPAPDDTMFWDMGYGSFEGWPQWNQDQENSLRKSMAAIRDLPPHEARKKLLELEKLHRPRRKLVWAELGEAPLAVALESLAILAQVTGSGLNAGEIDDLAAGYTHQGWKADDSFIRALEPIEKNEDLEVVSTVIRSIYQPWAEDSARHLQQIWIESAPEKVKVQGAGDNECIVFVDGLRLDCAMRLSEMLEGAGYVVARREYWAALPSVTGTGKPAVAPFNRKSNRIAEEPEGFSFEVMSAYHLRKALEESGYRFLEKDSHSHSSHLDIQKAWSEFGDIDHEGHSRGWKLARQMNALLREISAHVIDLLGSGWKTVRIVTDHGWLLLPGGLPKADLPGALSETKWGRCASLKPGSMTEERLYPWYWNPNRYFALADGISCFKGREEYAHGGLSLQECLLLRLDVSAGNKAKRKAHLKVTDVKWTGLRCKVAVLGECPGIDVDIRLNAGEADSSVVMNTKPLNENGMASVVVEDDELQGREVFIVLLDADGAPVAQRTTVIGGGEE